MMSCRFTLELNWHVRPSKWGLSWHQLDWYNWLNHVSPTISSPNVLSGIRNGRWPQNHGGKVCCCRLDFFLFNGFWHQKTGPLLHCPFEHGFFRASSNNCLKFEIMWANLDWVDIHPTKLQCPGLLPFPGEVKLIYNQLNYQSHYWDVLKHPPYYTSLISAHSTHSSGWINSIKVWLTPPSIHFERK